MSEKNDILLIGAGLAGPLLARFLALRDYRVKILERRPDIRKTKMSAGRSINLALSKRGLHALEQVNAHKQVMAEAIPMKGRLMHAVDGTTSFHRYGQDDSEVICSVSRRGLNKLLMNSAEETGKVEILFNEKCIDANLDEGSVDHENQDTGKTTETYANQIIATDGSASVIRKKMGKLEGYKEKMEPLSHGYKELTIPANEDGSFKLEPNVLHIWPRGNYMLIALPNSDGTFTCTLFFPMEGNPSFASLDITDKVIHFFREVFPDAISYLKNLEEEFFLNEAGNLGTVKSWPWNVEDRFLLMGDAAHAIVPFFGQGINAGFEDCTVLNEYFDEHGDNWGKIFESFGKQRKPDTDAIAQMALENYIEMRSDTADPRFLMKKEIEFALERRFPNRFIPRYSMVAFHRIPYSECLRRGRIQASILDILCSEINSVDDMDWERAEKMIREALKKIGVS